MRPHRPAIMALVFALSACASGPGSQEGPRRDRNRISAEEIATLTSAQNGWDVVQRLRPAWMRARGVRTVANPNGEFPQIFVDGAPFGPFETLRNVRLENIQEMTFMPGTDASVRYGTGYGGGVIDVITKK